ncbi:MAG: hypothetical protein K2G62_02615 [Oscillospiraceae bacterium]|nr:hypothetical protein [Oscillospiraceae bacterium]
MILAACFISVVITLADSVKPGDKFSSQLKLIFSLVFICGILTAALNGQYESGFDLSFDTDNIETYDSISGAAESSVISSAESSIADTVRNVLDENGVSYEKITASINIEEDSRININEIGYKGDEPERAAEVIRENIGDTEVRNIE